MLGKIRIIWESMAGERLRYGGAIAALVVASCFLYLVPLVTQITLDGALAPPSGEGSVFVTWSVELLGGRLFLAKNLWLPALLIAVLAGMAGLFTYLRGRWSARASEGIVCRVRDRVYDHLQHLPCSYFDSAETGDLLWKFNTGAGVFSSPSVYMVDGEQFVTVASGGGDKGRRGGDLILSFALPPR